jgi:hypothetical protein
MMLKRSDRVLLLMSLVVLMIVTIPSVVVLACVEEAYGVPSDINMEFFLSASAQDTVPALWVRVSWSVTQRAPHPRQAPVTGYAVHVFEIVGDSSVLIGEKSIHGAEARAADVDVRYPEVDVELVMFSVVYVIDERGIASDPRTSDRWHFRIPPMAPWPVDSVMMDTTATVPGIAAFVFPDTAFVGDTAKVTLYCRDLSPPDSTGRQVCLDAPRIQICLFYRDSTGTPHIDPLSAPLAVCDSLWQNVFQPDTTMTHFMHPIRT